jgi:hypothetical protein
LVTCRNFIAQHAMTISIDVTRGANSRAPVASTFRALARLPPALLRAFALRVALRLSFVGGFNFIGLKKSRRADLRSKSVASRAGARKASR